MILHIFKMVEYFAEMGMENRMSPFERAIDRFCSMTSDSPVNSGNGGPSFRSTNSSVVAEVIKDLCCVTSP